MSKYVKNLLTDHVRGQLEGVHDALLVNVVGLSGNTNARLRTELGKKDIHLLVVKNSLAARAVAGTALAPMFEGVAGSAAICWGASDIVALAKEITRLSRDKKYDKFKPTGGVMDGEKLGPEQVEQVSKWPSREEQLSLLVGQILGPGGRLASQLLGPGGAIASQIKEKAGGEDADADEKEGEAGQATSEAAPEATAT
jgi:large subunit ribosomal protein L10